MNSSASQVQLRILRLLDDADIFGLTVAELRDIVTDAHHGTISGVLSHLHKAGTIDRLAAKRGRCKIYVLPKFTNGRTVEPQGW